MVRIRTERLEFDEAWSFVDKKAKERPAPREPRQGRSVCFHRYGRNPEGRGAGKRNAESTMDYLHDLPTETPPDRLRKFIVIEGGKD